MSDLNARILKIEKRINRIISILGEDEVNDSNNTLIDNINKILDLKNNIISNNKNIEQYYNYCNKYNYELSNFLSFGKNSLNIVDNCRIILSYKKDLIKYKQLYDSFSTYKDKFNQIIQLDIDTKKEKLTNNLKNIQIITDDIKNFEHKVDSFILNYSKLILLINDNTIKN